MTSDVRDKARRYITVETQPDKDGKCRFVIDWWAWNPSRNHDSWRGQYFYARLEDYVQPSDVVREVTS